LVVITISGPHGAGKSTIAKALAKYFGFRYLSAGEVFRKMAKEYNMSIIEFTEYVSKHPEIDLEIDRRTMEEAKKGNIVIDAQLGFVFSKHPNTINILVIASKEDRVKRVMEREGVSYEEALKDVEIRDANEKERFKKLYNVELWNIYDFHVILNTSKLSKEESIKIAIEICKVLIQSMKEGEKNG